MDDTGIDKVKPRFEHAPRESLEQMHPGYFALVMTTGIVALAARLHGLPWILEPLFWLNALFLPCLVAATVARVVRYPRAVRDDLRSHSRAVGFYITVAAFGVFGVQLVLQRHALDLAIAGVLWVVTIFGMQAGDATASSCATWPASQCVEMPTPIAPCTVRKDARS